MAGDVDGDWDDAEGSQDPGVAVVRHVADANTVKSIKATLLTALLVRAVGKTRPRARGAALFAAGVAIGVVAQHGTFAWLLRLVG